MPSSNSEIADKLQGALDKLAEIVSTLEDIDDSEYENLETLTQPVIEAVDALAEAVEATGDSNDD